MSAVKECFKQIKNRPVIIIFTAVYMLILCIFEQFNSFTKDFGSFGALTKQSYLDTISLVSQKITDMAATPGIMALNIIVVLLLSVAVAAVLGIFGAGYGHTFYLSFLNDKRKRGEFRAGINRHYLKMIVYFFALIVLSLVMLLIVAFVTVPAIISVKVVLAGESSSIFSMLILCVLTVAALFFAIVFYTMYMTFIFPSVIAYKKGGVRVAFKMVNDYCWYLIPRTTLFLFAILVLQVALLAVGYGAQSTALSIVVLVFNWLFKTAAVFIYLYFVFGAFMGMKEDLFPSYDRV